MYDVPVDFFPTPSEHLLFIKKKYPGPGLKFGPILVQMVRV